MGDQRGAPTVPLELRVLPGQMRFRALVQYTRSPRGIREVTSALFWIPLGRPALLSSGPGDLLICSQIRGHGGTRQEVSFPCSGHE